MSWKVRRRLLFFRGSLFVRKKTNFHQQLPSRLPSGSPREVMLVYEKIREKNLSPEKMRDKKFQVAWEAKLPGEVE